MKKIYIYPNINNPKYKSFNPYIRNLYNAVDPYCRVVNKNYSSSGGILGMLPFVTKVDYLWFNWIEDIPDKKGGILQTLVLLMVVYYCKLTSVKIVWTLHNKFSHYKRNRRIKEFLFRFLMKKSDYILTHASEGKAFAATYGVNAGEKTKVLHHPAGEFNLAGGDKEYDILIWGSVIPYKGIDKFLEYLTANGLENRWEIRIVGRIPDKEYKKTIMQYASDEIAIEDKFIDTELLRKETARSRVVLYTYLQDTVLSSGAVMDSLAMGASVIGPACGSFIDLAADNVITTYRNFDHLIEILETGPQAYGKDAGLLHKFTMQNSWPGFGQKIAAWLNF